MHWGGAAVDLTVSSFEGSSIPDRGDHRFVQMAQQDLSRWSGDFVLEAGPDGIEHGLRALRQELARDPHPACNLSVAGSCAAGYQTSLTQVEEGVFEVDEPQAISCGDAPGCAAPVKSRSAERRERNKRDA